MKPLWFLLLAAIPSISQADMKDLASDAFNKGSMPSEASLVPRELKCSSVDNGGHHHTGDRITLEIRDGELGSKWIKARIAYYYDNDYKAEASKLPSAYSFSQVITAASPKGSAQVSGKIYYTPSSGYNSRYKNYTASFEIRLTQDQRYLVMKVTGDGTDYLICNLNEQRAEARAKIGASKGSGATQYSIDSSRAEGSDGVESRSDMEPGYSSAL